MKVVGVVVVVGEGGRYKAEWPTSSGSIGKRVLWLRDPYLLIMSATGERRLNSRQVELTDRLTG